SVRRRLLLAGRGPRPRRFERVLAVRRQLTRGDHWCLLLGGDGLATESNRTCSLATRPTASVDRQLVVDKRVAPARMSWTDVRQAEAGGSLIFRFGCGSRHPGPVWKRHPVPGPWTWCRRTCGNTGRGTVEPRRDEMVLNADTPVPVSCGPGYW